MKILALEFSSSQRSVAIVEAIDAGSSVLSSIAETGGRSTRAFALIEKALSDAKCQREQIDCIAVGIGPGSYTGIRAAIATAQGWQLAKEVKTIGINSIEAVAIQSQSKGIHGRVNVIVDAQRNEFYVSAYDISSTKVFCVENLHITSRADIDKRLAAGQTMVGPDIEGLERVTAVFPDAVDIARQSLVYKTYVSAEKLEPIYLRETTFVKAPPLRIIE